MLWVERDAQQHARFQLPFLTATQTHTSPTLWTSGGFKEQALHVLSVSLPPALLCLQMRVCILTHPLPSARPWRKGPGEHRAAACSPVLAISAAPAASAPWRAHEAALTSIWVLLDSGLTQARLSTSSPPGSFVCVWDGPYRAACSFP